MLPFPAALCEPPRFSRRLKSKESVDLATQTWVAWFNRHRLLEPIGNIPPEEAEANYYRQLVESAVPA